MTEADAAFPSGTSEDEWRLTRSRQALEQILVANYPVTVNTARPPQESGSLSIPSGPVPCRR